MLSSPPVPPINVEKSYRRLLNHLPGMAYRCRNDRNWTMEFVSRGSVDLTGYAPDDFIQNKTLAFNDVIVPSYREMLWDEWQAALREHRKFEKEYEITARTGETKWVWEQGEGVYDEQGRVVALEGFISDVTGRKRAETERERLIRAIEQSGETILITDPNGLILCVERDQHRNRSKNFLPGNAHLVIDVDEYRGLYVIPSC